MLIQLYTQETELDYTTLEWTADGNSVSEAKITTRQGHEYMIYKSWEADEVEWIIQGGMTFLTFDNKDEFHKAFISIQKGLICVNDEEF